MVPKLLSGEEQCAKGFRAGLGQRPGIADDTRRTHLRLDGRSLHHQRPKVYHFAQYSDRASCSPRTGDADTPNHKAITAFVDDVDTPGITVRPLRTMHDVDESREVYFDDVAVDASRMLGEPGDGWQLAMDCFPMNARPASWAAHRIPVLAVRRAVVDEVKGVGQAADSDG